MKCSVIITNVNHIYLINVKPHNFKMKWQAHLRDSRFGAQIETDHPHGLTPKQKPLDSRKMANSPLATPPPRIHIPSIPLRNCQKPILNPSPSAIERPPSYMNLCMTQAYLL